MGVPEEEARYYESEFQSGRAIVTVNVQGRYQEATDILNRYGRCGYQSDWGETTASEYVPSEMRTSGVEATGWGERTVRERETTGEDAETIRLHEEELRARKRPVESGEVRVRKEVVTENRTIDVPVTREEVVVERRPVNREATDADFTEGEEEISIPLMEEEVEVEKRPVVKEEVTLRKERVQDTQQVSDTVRREEAHVEEEGNVQEVDETKPRRRNRK
jgi:uncharacterized protein (TIGR02271 family)